MTCTSGYAIQNGLYNIYTCERLVDDAAWSAVWYMGYFFPVIILWQWVKFNPVPLSKIEINWLKYFIYTFTGYNIYSILCIFSTTEWVITWRGYFGVFILVNFLYFYNIVCKPKQ